MKFLDANDLGLFLETIEVASSDLDIRDAIRVIEDYKPLDVQSAVMALALCRGIRARYLDWKYLVDIYGHKAIASKPYTVSAFLGGILGRLQKAGAIAGFTGPATGRWRSGGRRVRSRP